MTDDVESKRPASGRAREAKLTSAFVTLTGTIVSSFDLAEFLRTLMDICVDLFPIDSAGLMLAGPTGRLRLVASSHESARGVELAQLAADDGPCLDSFAAGAPVTVPDIAAAADRWPGFARAAAAVGLRSSYATPMRLQPRMLGTINLFSTRLDAMDSADLDTAQALTDVATIGIVQERLLHESRNTTEQLRAALDSRVLIEQAKGVLATRSRTSMSDAFLAMRHYSRTTNTRLRDVATGVIEHSLEIPPYRRSP